MAKTKVHGEFLKDSVVRFTAKAGENITKGQAVYISGISGEVPVVSLADANDTAKMPAFGLAEATVSTNAEVEITSFGTLKGLDTSSYSLGDILYVDTTAGSLTNNPSGLEATKLQNIGMVQRVHASNGSIKVGGAGRTNAVPNLDDGDIFIGDSNNKAVSDTFTNVLNTEAGINSSANATAITIDSSENVGIGTNSPNTYSGYTTLTLNGTSGSLLDFEVNGTHTGEIYADGTTVFGIQAIGSRALNFKTNNAERMRIDATGVGIGTDSPNSWASYTDSAATILQVEDSSQRARIVINGGNGAHLDLVDYAGASNDKHMNISVDAGVLKFGSLNDAGNAFVQNNIMTMDLGTGNVGIGISNPATDLHVDSGDAGVLLLSRTSANTSGDLGILRFGNTNYDSNLAEIIAIQDGSQTNAALIFKTQSTGAATTERLRIDSAGRVGLGSQITSNQASTYDSRANDFVVSGGGDTGITIAGGSSEDIRISFTANGTTGLSKGSITYDNNADTLAIETGGTQRIRIDSDGLKFGSDTAAANALDDYEEGTWTPSVSGMTIATQTGNYTKIGDLVFIKLRLSWSAYNNSAGGVLTGLPFAADTSNESMAFSVYANSGFGSIPSGKGYLNAYVSSNNTTLHFTWQPNTAVAEFASSGNIYVAGTYLT